MTLRRGGVAVACVLAALVSGGCGLIRAAVNADLSDRVTDAEVNVAPEEILVRFPAAAATSWACAAPAAGGRQYAWSVRLDRSEPWHGIAVRAVLPASSADPGRTISPILDNARATVSRMAGTPPVPVDSDSTAVTAFAVGDTALVVRITDRAAIRRVARGRPLSATLMACADGNDAWTRDVPVRYDPRF
ncbi:MAG TPA: hypothetical protein VE871_13055 [Longimicrobium sp.]|nr:hypothetical protein [Longimicrobium sp.]